jgi:NAD(P)-dependent dehydrogenase (short-subunit alcohol dehydrogenase family)
MLEKKIVLVAAGNSELGLPITEFLISRKEFEIFATFRTDSEKSTDLKNLFENKATSHCLKTDLRDSNQVASLFSSVSYSGQIWGVLNFAGEASANRLVRTTQHEIENSILNNLMPAINLTTEFFKYAKEKTIPGGRLVHISSVTVRRPVPGTIPYVIAKSGIEGLVKASAEEAGRYKIAINALRLGYFDRGMATRAVPSEMLNEISKNTATLSLGTPENLFASLSYLLSEESAFHTGSIIDLDGGLV